MSKGGEEDLQHVSWKEQLKDKEQPTPSPEAAAILKGCRENKKAGVTRREWVMGSFRK